MTSNIHHDLARITTQPAKLLKLKGGKEQVDAEFARLREWQAPGVNYRNDDNIYGMHLVASHYDMQYFTAMVDFDKRLVQIEYEPVKGPVRFGTYNPYAFGTLDHLDRTIACWTHFRDFVAAIAE